METTITVDELLTLKSPIPGRTFISMYVPGTAPVPAVISQINSELVRTEKSTNWKLKGAVIMMLKQLKQALEELNESGLTTAPLEGVAVFVLPIDHLDAAIHYIRPDRDPIDLFFYLLDTQFYVKDDHFTLP